MSDYPEHDKLRAVVDASQAVGEFLDFGLPLLGLHLCEWREKGDNGEPEYVWTERALKSRPARADYPPRLHDYIDGRADHNPAHESWGEGYEPVCQTIQQLLAAYFDIDQDAIDREKAAMLEALRREHYPVRGDGG